ncbi:butyrate kinase [Acetobacterium carbinolicum]|uniref:butyrate kinase n=1 Tax=Acetobacterium carbinolicum TaxID=52690 RepID=UPI0039C947E5
MMDQELIISIVNEVLRHLALKNEGTLITALAENYVQEKGRDGNKMKKILVLNFGSTSSKISIFQDEVEINKTSIAHDTATLNQFKSVIDQRDFRKKAVLEWLESINESIMSFDAIAPRGGNVHPIASGTYQVNQDMVDDLESGQYGVHASALASIIGYELFKTYGIPAYTTDPIVVDEKIPEARLSGNKILKRISNMHVLNHKATARIAASQIGKPYEECNFVVAHMGGGITIGAHYNGKIIDANNGFDSDGPFSPERSGSLPVGDLVRLCFSGQYDQLQILRMINGEGGMKSYLGEVDVRVIEDRIDREDAEAILAYNAMAYQVAKEIGAYSVVSQEKLDAIVLTGGLAYSEKFTSKIINYISFLGPVLIFPGENEALALAKGALRVLNKEINTQIYMKEY